MYNVPCVCEFNLCCRFIALSLQVNLPAHLVVIKSTMHYFGGGFQECSESQILQMIGRAGRPQACLYVLLYLDSRTQWLINCMLIVEISQLLLMKILFLTTSLGKKLILPTFRLDALVLLKAIPLVS